MLVAAIIDPKRLKFDGARWSLAATTFQTVDGQPQRSQVEMDFHISPDVAGWVAGLKRSGRYDLVVDGRGEEYSISKVLANADKAVSVSPAPERHGDRDQTVDWPISSLAHQIRHYLENEVWPGWLEELDEDQPPPGSISSIGMCRVSSSIARRILADEYPEGDWKVVGGHPSVAYVNRSPREARRFLKSFDGVDGGMWDRSASQWDGHYWVRGNLNGEMLIVDLTADQYGWDPVVITDATDARYRANYTAAELKTDLSGPNLLRATEAAATGWANRNSRGAIPTGRRRV